MEYELFVGESEEPRSEKELIETVKKAGVLWRSADKKAAAKLLCEVFNEEVPDLDWFMPYVKEFGKEYRDLIGKLYLLHAEEDDDEWSDALAEFEDACGNDGLVSRLAARIVGDKWEEVRELFYDKCPECMFKGGEEEPYSLKLRSENIIECIPEDILDMHELASPVDDYGNCMDGYSHYEGYALVKDNPEIKEKQPPEIKAILAKLKERELKYFPNVIFPLVNGENMIDTCNQMLDLLQLLDHGYHFESINNYISDHEELFPEAISKRDRILNSLGRELGEKGGDKLDTLIEDLDDILNSGADDEELDDEELDDEDEDIQSIFDEADALDEELDADADAFDEELDDEDDSKDKQ